MMNLHCPSFELVEADAYVSACRRLQVVSVEVIDVGIVSLGEGVAQMAKRRVKAR